jgi:hypothetical protein
MFPYSSDRINVSLIFFFLLRIEHTSFHLLDRKKLIFWLGRDRDGRLGCWI